MSDAPRDHGPLDCGAVLDQLDAYLDGELTHRERQHLQTHLAACFPCADVTDFNAQLKALVRDRCDVAAPTELKQRIRVFLERA